MTVGVAPRHHDLDAAGEATTGRAAEKKGIYLGIGDGGWAWSGAERSVLVLGPSRSGKTTSVVIPNVIVAPGPVVTTSTKPDVMGATAAFRGRAGWTLLFDPSGEVDVPEGVVKIGWSPVNASREWDGALFMADAMVRAAHGSNRGARASTDQHWSERATTLLAPILHAAALAHAEMREVLAWVDRHDGAPALRVLAERESARIPSDALAGILATDQREQSGIWSTASGVLAAYRSTAALDSTRPPYLDADAFCRGSDTLYVCASGRQQQLLAPLVVGLLSEIKDATYTRTRAGEPGAPVLFALDEVANIAPLAELPSIVSEGAGQGLVTLACLQDLSQARTRWAGEADGFLSLFGTSLVLPGIADMATLSALSTLAGEAEVLTRSLGMTQGERRLRASMTTSAVQRRRLPPDAIARGAPGMALALDSRRQLGWVRLTPAHRDPPWRELLRAAREAPPLFGR